MTKISASATMYELSMPKCDPDAKVIQVSGPDSDGVNSREDLFMELASLVGFSEQDYSVRLLRPKEIKKIIKAERQQSRNEARSTLWQGVIDSSYRSTTNTPVHDLLSMMDYAQENSTRIKEERIR